MKCNALETANEVPETHINELMSQLYVIHNTGAVLLSRSYDKVCVSVDTQLVGGFLAAVQIFVSNLQSNGIDRVECSTTGGHYLQEISLSCSKWFIQSVDEYMIACLVSKDSPLLTENRQKLISDLLSQILSSYLIFVNIAEENKKKPIKLLEYSYEFGIAVDNIVYDSMYSTFGKIHEDVYGQVEIFQHVNDV
ncbi:MAG: hypothetical protein OEZ01_15745 [Candidatus Heimdallarchaeota archaeon]|nr:hypothetical protein [Candidatus Heimdallarchaeota archaeon]MDH5647463.1 hypothetical protein [Candidatus Heimdallarchaeota archaeon]